jgi:ribonuclease HI
MKLIPKGITIYTDGSCLKNPGGAGGIGAVIIGDGYYHEISEGFAARTTCNQMEIMAAVRALEFLKEPTQVKLYSDSKLLIKTMSGKWKSKKNLKLWEMLKKACAIHSIKWKWIPGHNGIKYNEVCDRLALAAAICVRDSNQSKATSRLPEPDGITDQLNPSLEMKRAGQNKVDKAWKQRHS